MQDKGHHPLRPALKKLFTLCTHSALRNTAMRLAKRGQDWKPADPSGPWLPRQEHVGPTWVPQGPLPHLLGPSLSSLRTQFHSSSFLPYRTGGCDTSFHLTVRPNHPGSYSQTGAWKLAPRPESCAQVAGGYMGSRTQSWASSLGSDGTCSYHHSLRTSLMSSGIPQTQPITFRELEFGRTTF